MSNQDPSGITVVDASGTEPEKQTVAYETFSKVLGEAKKAKADRAEMQARIESYEQAQLESEGKVKEANINLKALLEKSKAEQAKLAKTVQEKVIFAQFAREAEKMGCVDVKLAWSASDLSDIEVTEDLDLDQAKLMEKLSNLTKDKSFLFKKDVSRPHDVTPSGSVGKKSLSDCTDAELKELLRHAK